VKIISVWPPAGGIVKGGAIPENLCGLCCRQISICLLSPEKQTGAIMNLRLIIQPAVATILAIPAGLRDARHDRLPFFWAVLWNPAHRRELLRQGWKDVGKVFVLAVILDVVYQLVVHRGVYTLELLITAVILAIVPYILVRGLTSRIAKMVFDARSAMQQRAKTQ
jgi:hypothetical protein